MQLSIICPVLHFSLCWNKIKPWSLSLLPKLETFRVCISDVLLGCSRMLTDESVLTLLSLSIYYWRWDLGFSLKWIFVCSSCLFFCMSDPLHFRCSGLWCFKDIEYLLHACELTKFKYLIYIEKMKNVFSCVWND